MTIVVSGISPKSDLIVMTVDSAVSNSYETGETYTTGQKAFPIPGVGCVTTWGERTGNNIGQFLKEQKFKPETHTIDDLADSVNDFLKNHYKPHEDNLGDVGYHVAGFDSGENPHLHHIFWGCNRPPSLGEEPDYHYQKDVFTGFSIPLLYNGRNELAHTVMSLMLNELQEGREIVHDFRNHFGLIQLADFTVRFGAEMTFQVGPPFTTFLISPRNDIEHITNDNFKPIDIDEVVRKFVKLRYQVEGHSKTPHEVTIIRTTHLLRQIASPEDIIVNALSINLPNPHLHLDTSTHVKPDIFVKRAANHRCQIGDNHEFWYGVPDLIVEVLDQRNERFDRRDKFDMYERHALPELWLVQPKQAFIEAFQLRNGKLERLGVFADGDEQGFFSLALARQITQIEIEKILGLID